MKPFFSASFSVVIAAFALNLSAPELASAQTQGDALNLSPFWDWKTINTEHFRITFPAELAPQAQKVAQYYEEAHRVLAPEMKWEPNHLVNVLVTDQADAANGMALAISRFGMLLYLTPPESYFSTTYYEDWLKLLVFHEYTHYLNMDTTRGFYTVLRYIFGDVFLPNSLWPIWMLEGYAVYNETKYSRGGRGRSPYFEMITRTAVERNLLDDSSYITLDKVNGENPHPPGGETPYFFGYQLMHEADKTTPNANGEMSYRSGGRIPFFINGNLENVTNKTWYDLWAQWVQMSRARAGKDLETIRKNPVTEHKVIDEEGYDSMGVAVSPKETYLAYSSTQKEKWQSLYFRDLATGETERIEDKFLGVGMSFHPSEPILVYSTLVRQDQYYFYSDLKAYNYLKNTSYMITDELRAKDPDISRDGKFIVYTMSVNGSAGLGIGLLRVRNGELKVENAKTVFTPPMLDRVANPKFSPDGRWIVFSYKKNGVIGEELRRYDMRSGKIETLLNDKAMNRFATFQPNGNLYYVSDKTGVDNIYRLEGMSNWSRGILSIPRPVAMTNMTTGVWLPTVVSGTKAYASVYHPDGWKISEVPLRETSVNTISPPNAPAPVISESTEKAYPIEDYSAWSTLLPRQWAPFLFTTETSNQIGAQILGYDQVHRHQYFAYGAYDTQLKLGDFIANYANRSLGPTLSLTGATQSRSVDRFSNGANYTRKTELEGALSFPFRGDVAVLTPRIAASIEREAVYSYFNGNRNFFGKSRFVPTQEATLTFDNTRSSRWSVAPETGRRFLIGAKRYNDSEVDSFKGIVKLTEYWHLGNNWVLSPSAKALATSKVNNRFGDANGEISGKESDLFNPFRVDNFDQFYIRGYGSRVFNARRAFTGSFDLRFPVSQIFRGWGTNPIFLDQLSMNVFAETTYVPEKIEKLQWLPSAGAGLRLSTEVLLHLPLSFGIDYHYGFNKTRRAKDKGELFFSISFSNVLPIDI